MNQFVAPRGRCVGSGVYLSELIGFAYGVPRNYVSGGPSWIEDATFQIEATTEDASTATLDDPNQMLQTLLTERFKLKMHRTPQESQGYILGLGKGGLKIMQSSGDEEPPWLTPNARVQVTIKGRSSLNRFAQILTRVSAIFSASHETQPVVDKTELTGRYEYEFVLPDLSVQGGRGAYQPDGSQISKALEEQLGLRLQAEKVAVETLVIDQIERPSPN